MARKKIREYDSKRILKEFLKKLVGIEIGIKSAQVSSLESHRENVIVDGECGY